MTRIVDGKTYNTDTASLVCEKNYYYNGDWISSRDLYKTENGTYFFAIRGNCRELYAPADKIELITEKEAKVFVEAYGNPERYISEWGEPEEG